MPAKAPATIKLLSPSEVALMEEMMTLFGRAFNEVDTYCAARPSRSYMERLLGSDCFIAIAAIKNDQVVGGMAAYELPKFEQERSEIYIYDLAVDASHRRQGIATAMIQELVQVAAGRGAYVLFVQADQGDIAATELYSKLGKREDVLHFDIPIHVK